MFINKSLLRIFTPSPLCIHGHYMLGNNIKKKIIKNLVVSFSPACGRIYIKMCSIESRFDYRPGKCFFCKLVCALFSWENGPVGVVKG